MANKIVSSKPIKMWINGQIFSLQPLAKINKSPKKESPEEKNSNAKPPEAHENDTDDFNKSEYLKMLDITEEEGKYTTTIQVPKLYHLKLQQMPELDIKELSTETNTEILVPTKGQEGPITLSSDCTDNLVRATNKIYNAIGHLRDRTLPLQFTCIPILEQNIRDKFEELKKAILTLKPDIKGLHESIFISPLKLHLTIDVFALLDETEKAEAIRALSDYKSTLEEFQLQAGPLKLDVSSLDFMNDNIKKVDVLYANVKMLNETDEHSLQKIVNDISEHFYDRGLARRYQENVKLHMTIINTKYRKDLDSPKRKRRRQIDATKIMENFKDFNFGSCDFNSVHLSHMCLIGDDGFYKPMAVIKLDSSNKEDKT